MVGTHGRSIWILDDLQPLQGMREVHARLRADLEAAAAEFQRLLERDLASVNARAAEAGLAHIVVPGR